MALMLPGFVSNLPGETIVAETEYSPSQMYGFPHTVDLLSNSNRFKPHTVLEKLSYTYPQVLCRQNCKPLADQA